jgi:hypothetical protein
VAVIRRQTLTIANGATSSDAFECAGVTDLAVQLPPAFTGASITFTVSADNGLTFQELNEVSDRVVGTSAASKVLVTQGKSYSLPVSLTAWTHLKVVSASAEGAARSLVVVGKAS